MPIVLPEITRMITELENLLGLKQDFIKTLVMGKVTENHNLVIYFFCE